MLTSCKEKMELVESIELEHPSKKKNNQSKMTNPSIFIEEGCQYLLYKENEGTIREYRYMSHKGNCNNNIHLYNTPN